MTRSMTDLILAPQLQGSQSQKHSSLPLLSCRNCTQKLIPIANGQLRRTLNGQLIHTGMLGHTKYSSLITGEDSAPPALENIWKGTLFQVGCLCYLTQPILNTKSVELTRDPIADSVIAIDNLGEVHKPANVHGRTVILPEALSTQYISYRPQLNMYAVDFQVLTDEWGLKVGWKLELEEA